MDLFSVLVTLDILAIPVIFVILVTQVVMDLVGVFVTCLVASAILEPLSPVLADVLAELPRAAEEIIASHDLASS